MKAFSKQTLKVFLALSSILLLITVATRAQNQAAPTTRGQDPNASARPAASPKAKPRTRRTAAQSKTTPTPLPVLAPTPVIEKTPVASPSPVPASQAPTPSPAAEAVSEAGGEETPTIPKAEITPTPEARLREQLKVVEQMVAQGLKQEALAELHALAAENRFDPQGFYNIANAFARLDATDAAISAYRKAIDQRKGNYSRASNNLGVVLMRQGFLDQAYEAFLAALRTESFRYPEASYNLGRLYAARGEMERALREWRRALALDPNHSAAAQALRSAGDTRSVSRSTPGSSSANAMDADRAAPRNGTAAPSTSAAGPALTLDAGTHELLQRARAAHEQGRYEEAIAGFRRVIERQGGYFSPANLELSYSLIELRRNDEAIAALLLVVEKDAARYPITYYHLGRLYELRGDLQLAEEYYLRATQAHQVENAQFLLNLSGVREKRGDFAGALVALENYIKRKEQQGQKPAWSDERLASLRERAAAQPSKQ